MRTAVRTAAAACLVVGFTAFVTWPQAQHLSTHVAAHQDPYFSIWRLAWIAHALRAQPLHLFDANIFHPTPNTLAYSDATMLEGLIGAPLLWAGVPQASVYNLLLLAGFVGSGIGMFVLAYHLTRSFGASIVAAAVFTMMPYRIEHYMHLELQWAMFIPLTLWALHRAVEQVSWRWGAAAGLFVALQALACVYYGVFLAMTLVVFVPILVILSPRLVDDGSRGRDLLGVVGTAAVAAAALTIPLALPYRQAAADLGTRSAEEIARYSATPLSYFAATSYSSLWHWTADRWGTAELRLFPGAVALLLLIAASLRRPWRPVVIYAVVTAFAVELSFGVNGFAYHLFPDRVSALQGFRSWSRFAVVTGCGIAMLAGFGTDALARRLRGRVPLSVTMALVVALMLIDYSNRPLQLTPADPVSPPDVYRVIRSAAPGAVVELPMPDLGHLPGRDPFYSAWSTWHWKPLVNGYSGYYPQDYLDTLDRMNSFPDDVSIARLRAHDVRYIIVHRSFYDRDDYAALALRIAARTELKPWGPYRDLEGTADIFELDSR
jgi:hypothetical protein